MKCDNVCIRVSRIITEADMSLSHHELNCCTRVIRYLWLKPVMDIFATKSILTLEMVHFWFILSGK